jgi:hypothetical protein
MTDDPQATPDAPLTDVAVHRGAIGAVQADDLAVTVGAIGAARADRVSVEFGAVGALAAREATVTMSAVGAVAAQDARVSQAFVRTVFARDVHFARGSGALVVFAGRMDGQPTVLLDWRGGLVAGTIVAVVWLIVRRLR